MGFGLHRNVQRFRGGLVFKAHRLCVSLNSRLESNTEEEKWGLGFGVCAGGRARDLLCFAENDQRFALPEKVSNGLFLNIQKVCWFPDQYDHVLRPPARYGRNH